MPVDPSFAPKETSREPELLPWLKEEASKFSIGTNGES
jgi:hypothetical protein